jgi:hypothetical protein
MSKIFKPRRGTKSTFNTGSKSSTVLDEGEIFFEVPDSGQGKGRVRIKMGDGSSTYATLPYAIPFTEDELITHNGTDTKSVSASSSIGSSTVSTYLNNAKSGNTLKTIIHNLREAIYRNACDIVYLNNKKANTSHTHSQYAYYSDLQGTIKTVTYNSSYISSSAQRTVDYLVIGRVHVVSGRFQVSTAKPSGQVNYLMSGFSAPSGQIVPVGYLANSVVIMLNTQGRITSNDAIPAGYYNIACAYVVN